MTIAAAPLASAAEQNSAYARHKEGRSGKPGRPSLFSRLFPLQPATRRAFNLLFPLSKKSQPRNFPFFTASKYAKQPKYQLPNPFSPNTFHSIASMG